MDVITIESGAFKQIMDKLQSLESKFVELKMEASTPLSEKWLDTQEVVLLLKTSKRTLQSYRDDKIIGYSQVGHKIYYKVSDIERFLKNNYHKIRNY